MVIYFLPDILYLNRHIHLRYIINHNSLRSLQFELFYSINLYGILVVLVACVVLALIVSVVLIVP